MKTQNHSKFVSLLKTAPLVLDRGHGNRCSMPLMKLFMKWVNMEWEQQIYFLLNKEECGSEVV
jgi:hypothetical protein